VGIRTLRLEGENQLVNLITNLKTFVKVKQVGLSGLLREHRRRHKLGNLRLSKSVTALFS
jgi:hypothetical protein